MHVSLQIELENYSDVLIYQLIKRQSEPLEGLLRSGKNDHFSRSGKSQGCLLKSVKIVLRSVKSWGKSGIFLVSDEWQP